MIFNKIRSCVMRGVCKGCARGLQGSENPSAPHTVRQTNTHHWVSVSSPGRRTSFLLKTSTHMLYGYIIIGQAHAQLIFDGRDLNAAGSVSGQWLGTLPCTPRTPLCFASVFAVDICTSENNYRRVWSRDLRILSSRKMISYKHIT